MLYNTSVSREPAGDCEPIRLIYIMGAVRSGSTLWDTILGNHPDVESVGELCNVSENGWVSSRMCACGETATQCPFWSEIRREWARLTGTDDEAGYGDLVRRLEKHRLWLPRLESEARNGSARVREYSERTKALYEAIRTVSGKSVLVDSSKRPSRALLLSKIPGIDMTLIHLVRDARGVAWSEQKRLKNAVQAGLPKNYGVKSVGHTAMLWTFVNMQASWMRGRLPAWKSIRLRYEDSIARPHEALDQIGGLADVDYSEVAQAIVAGQPLGIGHTIAGNNMRMSGAVRLRADTQWIENLSPWDRKLCWAIAGSVLRRYGYGRRPEVFEALEGQSDIAPSHATPSQQREVPA